jgi:hypothetical protein
MADPTDARTAEAHAERLAEYKALRDEVLARIGMRNQIVNFAVIVLAALFAVSARDGGVPGGTSPAVLLAYPILAFFLARGWVNHDTRIGEIGEYIRTRLENGSSGFQWDGYLFGKYQGEKHWVRPEAFFAAGLFAGTSALVTVLAVRAATLTPVLTGLLVLDLLAIGWTVVSVGRRSQIIHPPRPKDPKKDPGPDAGKNGAPARDGQTADRT